ncbi:MAG: EAL domain-containing protein [Pyrinomonadaceae bacterium MAG19_C2-C3]|nr:EAL domain-containing protein [Pyrinomonadaceae bacterium MAG19_C2-C3]
MLITTVLILAAFPIAFGLFFAYQWLVARRRVKALQSTCAHASGELARFRIAEEDLRKQASIVKLLYATGAATNESATIDEALRLCLERISDFMNCPLGHVLLLADDETGELVTAHLWHCDDAVFYKEFMRRSEELRFKSGTGLPGRVLETGQALWVNYPTNDGILPRADEACAVGIRTGFAFPLLIGTEVAGVVEFFMTVTQAPDRAMLEAMMHLGTQLGRVLERARASQALRESEERYALAAHGANDGLWDWDVRGNQVFFSTRWKAMIGCEDAEIGGNPQEWFSRVHLEDIDMLRVKLTAHLDGHSTHFECEYRILHRHGGYQWMLARGVAVRNLDGMATRLAGSQTDITERKRVEEQLQHDAFHDALTGLPNRPLFLDRLRLALEHAKRTEDHCFGVLYLDFDRFKNINDGLGHAVGDRLLALVAARVQKLLRAGDTVARFNGDEFAILLDRIEDASEPVRIAERIERALERPFNVDEHEVFTTVSIGIALSSTGYDQPQEVLRDADAAMYRAKAAGRARHEVFDEGMHTRAVERLHLETDLRRAVDRGELRVYYQPIMTLATGELHGFEALVRWQHPRRGFLLPAEFISIAEESGLIVPLGLWVLREACRQMRVWHEAYPLETPPTISVNLATKQLQHPEIVEQIAGVLRSTGVDSRCVKLEITESGMMEDSAKVISILHSLKALGVSLSIDDFGTGYSSLSYLHRFPVNALKIDRSFISELRRDDENWQIVRTIITLAQNLGMETVAEGIEVDAQVKQLAALDCAYGQGYFFARPLSTEAATNFIRQRQPPETAETYAEEQSLDVTSSLSPFVH